MMRLLKPSFEILSIMHQDGIYGTPLELIEVAGRTCYKSEDSITSESAKKFVQNLTKLGHHSVLEHSAMTVKFIIDRGVSHELVRHRLCAFSQESTRYCDYNGEIEFIIPPWCANIEEMDTELGYNISELSITQATWFCAMRDAEWAYKELRLHSWSPQQARSVLPNSLKTEVVVTTNFREWRHIFKLRCATSAHPQMREIMLPLLSKCKELIPIIFDDIKEEG